MEEEIKPGDEIKPGSEIERESVDYRQYESCGSCAHCSGGLCDVCGSVSPTHVCDLWKGRTKDEGKDAEFYMKEYKKVKK